MQEFVKHETARKEKKCKYQQRGGCVCVCVSGLKIAEPQWKQ